MTLSGPESMTLTHALRAQHDGILVGIDTVLTDDPCLTVRLVEGPDPQPIVLDSRLRTPVDARLFRHPTLRPWIATTTTAERGRERALIAAGARVVRVPPNDDGQVDLAALLPRLRALGIASLMVEGGARVITSFLAGRAVDRLVLTIAPLLVGGLNAVGNLAEKSGDAFPTLRNPRYQWFGPDLVLLGELQAGLERSLDLDRAVD
jgi:3,4-dihydroxy 2-butanone 4-phosphate synthase/GTP cyclohydrolase II